LKEDNHKLKYENVKLKTRVLFLDKEISKRDKFVEQTISSSQNNTIRPKRSGIIIKTSLVNNLKKQLRDDRDQIKLLQDELNKHQKDRKTTTINELDAVIQTLTDECVRLRGLLKQSLKQEDQVS
jgi:predicted phage-related endonuclease